MKQDFISISFECVSILLNIFPCRFGLVQFKKDLNDKSFSYNSWHLYRALFEVFDAMHVSIFHVYGEMYFLVHRLPKLADYFKARYKYS